MRDAVQSALKRSGALPLRSEAEGTSLITTLGIVEGEILTYLERNGAATTLRELTRSLEWPARDVMMAVGGLVRERLVRAKKFGFDVVIELAEKPAPISITEEPDPEVWERLAAMEQRWLIMMWWSGALGLLAAIHLGRAVADVPVSIGSMEVPIWLSAVIGLIAGAAALWLLGAADGPARRARQQQARQAKQQPKKPDTPEAADEPRADIPCGLHAVVAADEDDRFVDED